MLPDSVVDPMELLSYLDPPDLNTPPSSGASSNGNNTTNDDILALFDWLSPKPGLRDQRKTKTITDAECDDILALFM